MWRGLLVARVSLGNYDIDNKNVQTIITDARLLYYVLHQVVTVCLRMSRLSLVSSFPRKRESSNTCNINNLSGFQFDSHFVVTGIIMRQATPRSMKTPPLLFLPAERGGESWGYFPRNEGKGCFSC